MPTGKIIFYEPEKRQGYLRMPDTLEDFFFRLSPDQPDRELVKGAWVTFFLRQDRGGYRAENVQPLALT